MFISFLYMFRATMCPSSGETTVFMRHLVLVTLCGSLSGTQCIDTVVSPDDGHIVARNMQRKEINMLWKIVHQVVFIYKMMVMMMMICNVLTVGNNIKISLWLLLDLMTIFVQAKYAFRGLNCIVLIII